MLAVLTSKAACILVLTFLYKSELNSRWNWGFA